MEALEAACKSTLLKTIKFDDLPWGIYPVEQFRIVSTKFGERVIVHTEEFQIFLPPRFSKWIDSAEKLAEINGQEYVMIFSGRDKEGSMPRLNVDFKLAASLKQQTV